MRRLAFIILFAVPATALSLETDEILRRDQADGVKIVRIERAPHQLKRLSAEYDLQGLSLANGEAAYLIVPPQIADGILDFASVSHRQDPGDEEECFSTPKSDCLPGYTSLEVFSEDGAPESRDWRCWGGRGSGPCNSKFAELRRGTAETDNLYEWFNKGHVSAHGSPGKSKEALRPRLLRVRSLGPDTVLIHKVIIKILPPRPAFEDTVLFADGMNFGDFVTARGRRYPGDASQGDYGNALRLSRSQVSRHRNFPKNWDSTGGEIHIPLLAGASLISVDIAIGDMRRVPGGADPEDYRGGAVLALELIRADGSREVIMDGENVGENGVMRASPLNIDRIAQPGDQLRLRLRKGSASVMGIRLGYGGDVAR